MEPTKPVVGRPWESRQNTPRVFYGVRSPTPPGRFEAMVLVVGVTDHHHSQRRHHGYWSRSRLHVDHLDICEVSKLFVPLARSERVRE